MKDFEDRLDQVQQLVDAHGAIRPGATIPNRGTARRDPSVGQT